MADGATCSLARYAETLLPTRHGALRCIVFRARSGVEHVALVAGDVGRDNDDGDDVLCRLHSECLTGEAFGSLKCDCKAQLESALHLIAQRGRGVVVYLRQEGRGIGLGNKIRAYALQEKGADTVDANRLLGLPDDARDYAVAAAILRDLGVRSAAVMTNNPEKVGALERHGILARRVPHVVAASPAANAYLRVKQKRMGHVVEDN